jgi:transcriptional regulator with XRE-family HTH domain
MNYTALFAAIKAEAKRRRISISRLDNDFGYGNHVVEGWVMRGKKPAKNNSLMILKRVTKCLKIDIKEFADLETIGGRIEYLRIKKGFTSNSVPGVSPSTISINERNVSIPSSETIMKLALELDSTPDWILNGDVKPVQIGRAHV